ncbi:H/ACA ribonucleo protein complex, subunit Gar1/Naf1, partial [Elsinoe ampelina]
MTKNEKPDEIIAKPDITLTPDMRIVPLGLVELSVDNIAVVKAFTSGEFRVVESGSALCLENRTIIGAVMEAIGRVTDPRYTVAFTNKQE